MVYRLGFVPTLALARFGLVNGMEVRRQANLASTYLCNDRADRPVCANMCDECPFSWSYSKSKEFSAVFGCFPNRLPLAFHCLTDSGFVFAIKVFSDSGSGCGSDWAPAIGF